MSQLGRQVSREGEVVCATDATIVIPGIPSACHSGARSSNHLRPSFRDAPLGAGPESITTKLRLGHDGARVMFKSGSGGYGFRARAPRAPE
jgi:hypothetical protein